jgi:hypothetical protein
MEELSVTGRRVASESSVIDYLGDRTFGLDLIDIYVARQTGMRRTYCCGIRLLIWA